MLREDIILLQRVKLYCDEKIEEIQRQCDHPDKFVSKEHGANTGNYDPSADRWWTDFHCQLCDKRWTEHRREG